MARTPKIVEDRREQIMDAAIRVFAQKGFLKATNKDIAREAGITPGLIYYYFESKEALLSAIIEARSPIHLLKTLPSQALALPPETFVRFILGQVLTIVEGEAFIGLLRVLLPEMIHNPSVIPIPQMMFQRILHFLNSYFEAKTASGEIRPVNVSLTVQVLVGSVMGFVLRRQVIRDPSALELTQEQIIDAIVETVLKGVLPR